MTGDEQFAFYQQVGDMFEAHGKPRPAPGVQKLFWGAMSTFKLADVEDAIAKAMRDLRWPARPAELRDLIFVARRAPETAALVYRCHFHGDGKWFDDEGIERTDAAHPERPSANPTVWWCDRCTYFVRCGKQAADEQRGQPSSRSVVRDLADAKADALPF